MTSIQLSAIKATLFLVSLFCNILWMCNLEQDFFESVSSMLVPASWRSFQKHFPSSETEFPPFILPLQNKITKVFWWIPTLCIPLSGCWGVTSFSLYSSILAYFKGKERHVCVLVIIFFCINLLGFPCLLFYYIAKQYYEIVYFIKPYDKFEVFKNC